MSKLRVLVVDDSAVNRKIISDILDTLDGVGTIDYAGDGVDALKRIELIKPDLITLDLEMPRFDGFKFLGALMAKSPIPVIVVSGNSQQDNVFRALELGALDFIEKPHVEENDGASRLRRQLIEKVETVRRASPVVPQAAPVPVLRSVRANAKPIAVSREPDSVVVLGASTGGPSAIVRLFSELPMDTLHTFVVAQHMPPSFTRTFAARLDALGEVEVVEAGSNELLQAGKAYICPGGRCIELAGTMKNPIVRTLDPHPDDRYIPSIDRLFVSASDTMGPNLTGVVLTGMGDDGARGSQRIKERGGLVLAEAPDTAVVFGMPEAAQRTGAVDRVLPLPDLCQFLKELTTKSPQ